METLQTAIDDTYYVPLDQSSDITLHIQPDGLGYQMTLTQTKSPLNEQLRVIE